MFGKDMYQRMMNQMFRKADDAYWDLMTGKIAIKTDDGLVTMEGEGDDAAISLNIMDGMAMPIPAFAQKTPVESIHVGDLVYNGGKVLGWVVGKDDKNHLKIIRPAGTRTTWTPPKVTMIGMDMGGSGAMVLRSLFNTLPDGNDGVKSLQTNLMPMLMMMGDRLDMEKMMPMILMTSMNGGAGALSGGMLQNMMMMSMMSGGSNPMAAMFGGMGAETTTRGRGSYFDRPGHR